MITFAAKPVALDVLGFQHYYPNKDARAFHGVSSLPILITELASVIGHFVLAFKKQDELFVPVILTDMGFNRNLYVGGDGRWMARYLPMCLRNYPFCLVPNDAGERVLGIANDALVSPTQDGALALFHKDGSLCESVEESRVNIENLEKAFQQTLGKTKVLSDEGLIIDWPMKVRLEKEKEPVAVEGLYRIDTERLLALGGDKLEHLKENGVLTFALSQPMSMQHTSVLMERAAYLLKKEGAAKKAAPVPNKPSFDLSDDEMISF